MEKGQPTPEKPWDHMGPNFPEVQLKAGASDCKEHAWRRLGLAALNISEWAYGASF